MAGKGSAEHLWRTLPGPTPSDGLKRNGHSAVAVCNVIYIAGGFRKTDDEDTEFKDLLRFDIHSNSWKTPKPLPSTFKGIRYHAVVAIEETLWYSGGYSSEAETGRAYEEKTLHTYNVRTQEWAQVSPKTSQLARHAHAAAQNPVRPNQILIYGGASGSLGSSLHQLLVLDTDRQQVTEMIPTNLQRIPDSPRSFATLTALGSLVVLFGGKKDGRFMVDKEVSCQIYCPQRNAWLASFPLLAKGRSGHSAVAVEGKGIYIFGGTDQAGQQPSQIALLEVDAKNPKESPQLTVLPCNKYTPTGRHSPAVAIQDGTLYVFGGRAKNGYLGDSWATSLTSSLAPTKGRRAKAQPASSPAALGRSARGRGSRGRGGKQAAPRQGALNIEIENDNTSQWKSRKRRKGNEEEDAALDRLNLVVEDSPLEVPVRKNNRPFPSCEVQEGAGDDVREKLNAVRHQAAAAKQKYESAVRDLNEAHQSTSVELRNSLQNARDELKEKGEAIERLKREFEHEWELQKAEVQALKEKLASELSCHTLKTNALESSLSSAKAEAGSAEEKCRKLMEQVAGLKASTSHLEAQLMAQNIEVTRLKDEAARVASSNQETEANLKTQAAQHKQEAAQLRESQQSMAANLQAMEGKLAKERQASDKAVESRDLLQKEVTEMTLSHAKAMESLNNSLACEQDRSSKLRQEVQGVTTRLGDLQDQLRRTEKEKSTARQEWTDLKTRMLKDQEFREKVEAERDSYRKLSRDALKDTLEMGQNLKRRILSAFPDDHIFS